MILCLLQRSNTLVDYNRYKKNYSNFSTNLSLRWSEELLGIYGSNNVYSLLDCNHTSPSYEIARLPGVRQAFGQGRGRPDRGGIFSLCFKSPPPGHAFQGSHDLSPSQGGY
jgi:hypothetical protein